MAATRIIEPTQYSRVVVYVVSAAKSVYTPTLIANVPVHRS